MWFCRALVLYTSSRGYVLDILVLSAGSVFETDVIALKLFHPILLSLLVIMISPAVKYIPYISLEPSKGVDKEIISTQHTTSYLC